MRWLLFIDQFDKGIGKPELGIGVFSFGSKPGITDEGIIGPEYQCKSIKQKDSFIHATKVKISAVAGRKHNNPDLTIGETGLLFINAVLCLNT
jgi:hypothetical protein